MYHKAGVKVPSGINLMQLGTAAGSAQRLSASNITWDLRRPWLLSSSRTSKQNLPPKERS